MPIPLIIAGLAAAGIGALGHIGAKEMNEEAERLSRKAQRIYNEENTNLQMVQKRKLLCKILEILKMLY